MANVPILANGENEKDANYSNLDYEIESFEIVKTSLLFDTLSDESSLVAVNGAMRMSLETVHPFTAEDVHVEVRRNESLGLIVKQCVKFLSHSLVPIWVVKGSGKRGWLRWEESNGNIARGKRIVSMGGHIPKHL